MCEIARVSRAGYYKWLKSQQKNPKDYYDYLLIKEVFDKGKRKYGWRNIQMKLKETGIKMNHKKIARIKNKYGLITKIRRRNPYKDIVNHCALKRTALRKEHWKCSRPLDSKDVLTISAFFQVMLDVLLDHFS
ncbi:MAG: IS3 family transposase, partial [Candidatus Komeilibacteria bacterium]|nr:IS3 family transposase [Candidatus Komeilibacteria bacterium]